jgi:hypothetical protein
VTRKGSTILVAAVLGGAFLTGLAAVTAGAGWRQWGTARRGAGLPLAAEAAAGAAFSRNDGRPAFVVLEEALPSHPAWQELTELTGEVEREQQSLAAEAAASAEIARQAGSATSVERSMDRTAAAIAQTSQNGRGSTRAALEAAYARRSEAERSRLQAGAEQQVAQRRAVLSAQVDEQVGVKRGELKTALAARIEQIRRDREARLLSLQLQLGLKDKDPAVAARAESLQEELRQVQASIERDIKAAQQDTDDQLAAYARQIEATAGQELRSYAEQVGAEADRQAGAAEQALTKELAGRLSDLDGSDGASPALRTGVPSGGAAQPRPTTAETPTPLQLRRNALQAARVAEVRRVATVLARQRGLGEARVVATPADQPAGGVDLTAAVADLLAKRSGR